MLFLFICLPALSWANADFKTFIDELKQEATKRGYNAQLIDDSFNGDIKPLKKVKVKLNKQPEVKATFKSYTAGLISDRRVKNGRKYFKIHAKILSQISQKYGLAPEVIVALWGVESAYGKYKGKFPILPSLATLAWDSHRKTFFRKELFHALQILKEGHIGLKDMQGSWAGAMGQCQFMPSSFISYAVDGNNDGKKDIWKTQADVFASTANYITKHGWKKDEKWGQRVVLGKILPANLQFNRRHLTDSKPLSYWKKLGIYAAKDGFSTTKNAALFLPEGPSGRAWLVYNNFNVIMRWNNSSYFAFSVLTLADRIAEKS